MLAQILRGRQEASGIAVQLFDSGFSGLLVGGFPGIWAMVAENSAESARKLLRLPENQAGE